MTKILFNLWTARALVVFGVLAGYGPVGSTFRHIGNESFRLASGSAHSWHHFLREGVGDLGASAAILIIMFAAPQYRNPVMWWVMLTVMIGFYAPFWIGAPFMAELAAPSLSAEIAHLLMAVPALLGCFLARRHFITTVDAEPIPGTA